MSYCSKNKNKGVAKIPKRFRFNSLDIARIIGEPDYIPNRPIPSLLATLHDIKGVKPSQRIWCYKIFEVNDFLTRRFLERV